MHTYQPVENSQFIGRRNEIQQLTDIGHANKASIVVLYGRRRVGKTELIEQTFRDRQLLKFEGIEGQNEQYQRQSLLAQVAHYTGDALHAKIDASSWRSVFELLASLVKEGPWTLYFEEVQWLANYQDLFAAELKYSWDNFLRHNPQLVLVLCGSAPSFMINHIVKSKALYNRSQYEIPLREFSFEEARQYLGLEAQAPAVAFEAYLAVGGIPEYLNYLKTDSSTYLALCQHSFRKGSFFSKEWERIFVSAFAGNAYYKKIVECLATRAFATRDEIAKAVGMRSGGGLTDLLHDLEQCGFVGRYAPYQAKAGGKLIRYRIADNYMHFFLSFIRDKLYDLEQGEFDDNPTQAMNITQYRQWLGYAFERFCLKNHKRIAKSLGFSSVTYRHGPFFNRSTHASDPGYQIDLVFDRADKTVCACEIKYTETPASVSVGRAFSQKMALLPQKKNTRYERILISANGATRELETGGYFDRILTLDDILLG